ncbi:hypothetical protein BC830DRAFT_1175963 [Chytriomyces sp. MP71]|nr:hypothetical protein BC830DRAFT_1175963 [Chytriomyces sp. MP71]
MNEEEKPSPPPEVQFAAHVRGGIGHMTFGVSDLLAATAFYDAVLPCDGQGYPHCSGYGEPGKGEALALRPNGGNIVTPFTGRGVYLA